MLFKRIIGNLLELAVVMSIFAVIVAVHRHPRSINLLDGWHRVAFKLFYTLGTAELDQSSTINDVD